MRQHDPWRAPLGALARFLLESLWPADCLLCGGWLRWRQHGGVCDACWGALPWTPRARPLRHGPLAAVVWAGDYGGALRRLVRALKFEGFDPLGVPLGRAAAAQVGPLVAAAIAGAGIPAPDLVVPVPLHWTRRWRRGFNQSLLLAEGVAEGLRLPLSTAALARQRRGRRQMGLRRRDRLVALEGVFSAPSTPRLRPRTRPLAGRTVLLVDDVTTTGATLEACARVLRRAGARAVIGCAIARTPRDARRSGAHRDGAHREGARPEVAPPRP